MESYDGEEFGHFFQHQLSPDDNLPAVTCDSHVAFVGAVRFPLLTRVMTMLSVIAHSNADSERVFSVVQKIDTDSCLPLGNDTLRVLLSWQPR